MEFEVTPTTTPTRMRAWLEQAWLVRYMDRELSSEETTWFESYAMDKPELLAMIESDTHLRDAMAADSHAVQAPASAGGERDRVADDEQPTRVTPLHGGALHAARPAVWLAAAAALVIGLGVGSVGMRSLTPRAPDIVASPTRVVYDTLRGAAAPPRVEHADSESVLVLIEVAVPPGAERITLKMDDEQDQVLTPGPDGFVNFVALRKKLLQSRDTRIEYSMLGKETRLPIVFR
jgi:hypothetical protein